MKLLIHVLRLIPLILWGCDYFDGENLSSASEKIVNKDIQGCYYALNDYISDGGAYRLCERVCIEDDFATVYKNKCYMNFSFTENDPNKNQEVSEVRINVSVIGPSLHGSLESNLKIGQDVFLFDANSGRRFIQRIDGESGYTTREKLYASEEIVCE